MTRENYEILLLDEKDVEQCISYKDVLTLVEESWKQLDAKQAFQFRSKPLEMGEGLFALTVGCAEGAYIMGGLIPMFFDNPQKYGLPALTALFALFDSKTGMPVCMMSAHNVIRAVKTGCVAAITAKYFAKKDSRKAAIIGTGYQAISHFLAIRELFNLEEVQIFDISKGAEERFAQSMGKYGIKISPKSSIEEAMRGCEIVMTLTTADAPLVKKEWIKEGMLFLKIGTHQEMEPEVILIADKLIVDWWDYVRIRSVELDLLLKQGLINERDLDEKKLLYAEVSEVAAGRKKGRENDAEKIVSVQYGMVSDYAVVATLVYNRAVEAGIGINYDLLARKRR